MWASRKAIRPNRNKLPDEMRSTSPTSENTIPNPNQRALPCKPELEYSQRNRQTNTDGLTIYSRRCKFLKTAMISNAVKMNARLSQRDMDSSCLRHVIARVLAPKQSPVDEEIFKQCAPTCTQVQVHTCPGALRHAEGVPGSVVCGAEEHSPSVT